MYTLRCLLHGDSAPTITGQVGSTLMPAATVAPAPAEVLQGGNGKFNHRDRMWHG